MAENPDGSVLRRMAEAGRGNGGGAPPTPAQAFGLAAAKAAQDLFGLAVSVAGAQEIRAALADLPERLPERALLAVMEGPGEGLGLVALSQEVLATLIEVQTTGRAGAAEVVPRRPTRTDAAMSLGFIERVQAELEALLAADPAITWAGGFRYASFLDDSRPLGVLFEDAGFRLLNLTLALGETGARTGTVMLAVPAEGRGAPPRPGAAPEAGARPAGPAAAEWSGRMERAVLGAEMPLDAVLDRIRLPLAEVAAWVPGTLIRLPPGAIGRVRIEGLGRCRVAGGRLGQFQGHLAVRLDPVTRAGAERASAGFDGASATGADAGGGGAAALTPAAPPSEAAPRGGVPTAAVGPGERDAAGAGAPGAGAVAAAG